MKKDVTMFAASVSSANLLNMLNYRDDRNIYSYPQKDSWHVAQRLLLRPETRSLSRINTSGLVGEMDYRLRCDCQGWRIWSDCVVDDEPSHDFH